MKTINIKGKPYVEVKERVSEFHKLYPKGSITTELLSMNNKTWVVKATVVTDVDNPRVFTGHAQEVESEIYTNVNSTSALENAETSAVGRALGVLNIGTITSIASANEVQIAITKQKQIAKKGKTPSAYNQELHSEVTGIGNLPKDQFLQKVKEFEAKGGGYDSQAKKWFIPKKIINQK